MEKKSPKKPVTFRMDENKLIVLQAEAKARNIEVAELLREKLESKISDSQEVTDDEIIAFKKLSFFIINKLTDKKEMLFYELGRALILTCLTKNEDGKFARNEHGAVKMRISKEAGLLIDQLVEMEENHV
jgi:hypothetical protein